MKNNMTKYEQEIRDCVAEGLFNDPWAIRQFLREVDAMHGTIERVEAECTRLRGLLSKADEALKLHGGIQYTTTWIDCDIAAAKTK